MLSKIAIRFKIDKKIRFKIEKKIRLKIEKDAYIRIRIQIRVQTVTVKLYIQKIAFLTTLSG